MWGQKPDKLRVVYPLPWKQEPPIDFTPGAALKGLIWTPLAYSDFYIIYPYENVKIVSINRFSWKLLGDNFSVSRCHAHLLEYRGD